MGRRKRDRNRFGLFAHANDKSLQENLFHLLTLYDILIKQCIALIPDEQKKEEFAAAHKRINNQRLAYKQSITPANPGEGSNGA